MPALTEPEKGKGVKNEGNGRSQQNDVGDELEARALLQTSTEESSTSVPAGVNCDHESDHDSAVSHVSSHSGSNTVLSDIDSLNVDSSSSVQKFDVLRFKNRFLEVVEELRMRRGIDAENEDRITRLVTENHDLERKLEEEKDRCSSLIEEHSLQEQETMKQCEQRLKNLEEEKAKNDVMAECWEQEIQSLKDELRTLHLTKYNLEKKLQDHERQLHLQSSSRDSFLSKMNQLEQRCSVASKQAENITEQIECLEKNVKEAGEIHKRLHYVNEHQKCELKQCKEQLETCRRELVDVRVQVVGHGTDGDEDSKSGESELLHARKTRSTEQELKMQMEINKQMQSQLLRLREEHQAVLQQLRDAHTLTERHIESSAKLGASEMLMQEEMCSMQLKVEELKQKSSSSESAYQTLNEKYLKEKEEWNEKCSDVEQRLKTLQSDYYTLRKTHDVLENTKSTMEKELKCEIEVMKEHHQKLQGELAKAQENVLELTGWKDKVQQLQDALEQSESILAEKEACLQEKDRECSELKKQNQQIPTATTLTEYPVPEISVTKSPVSQVVESKTGEEVINEAHEVESGDKAAPDVMTSSSSEEIVLSPEVFSSPVKSGQSSQLEIEGQSEMGAAKCTSVMTPLESKRTSPKLCLLRIPIKLRDGAVVSDNTGPPLVDHQISDEGETKSPTKRCSSSDIDDVSETKKPRIEKPEDTETKVQIQTESIMNQLRTIPQSEKESSGDATSSHVNHQADQNLEATESQQQQQQKMVAEEQRDKSGQDINTVEEMDDGSAMHDPNSLSMIVFSEDDEEDMSGVPGDFETLVNTQMSKQIEKIQLFLKMDRLRKPKQQ